jgi:hypothetical protein
MTTLRPMLVENPLGTRASAFDQALDAVKSFIFNQMKINPMPRRLYGFRTKTEAKFARNSFAQRTLGLRLQWNDDFTEDPPSLSPIS